MIVTVTMNPAIDKTVDIDRMERGGLNRIKRIEVDAGGKGINVSKTIQALGGTSIATGFLGGNSGKLIQEVLIGQGIQHDFVMLQGETRTNTKVVESAGEVTELNEAGLSVPDDKMQELLSKLEGYAGPETLFVLSGSVPAGVDKGIYGKITEMVHQKGSTVLLDADGELFVKSLPSKPDMMKPNREELEEYYKMDYRANEKELLHIGQDFLNNGTKQIAISMGRQGALFLSTEGCFRCPGLSVKAHSTVGAGDAMVAALAYSWDAGYTKEQTMTLCMAVSAGAVTTIGTKPPTKDVVEELKKQVVIEAI
ncbi:MAG: 1-phosphofructokinase [Lachnospiraceae bacterium]|nr:1-phosphofructokinase [Lachnospiraceae bacterium]